MKAAIPLGVVLRLGIRLFPRRLSSTTAFGTAVRFPAAIARDAESIVVQPHFFSVARRTRAEDLPSHEFAFGYLHVRMEGAAAVVVVFFFQFGRERGGRMIDGVFARSVVVGGGVAFAGFGGAAAFDFVVHISCHGGFWFCEEVQNYEPTMLRQDVMMRGVCDRRKIGSATLIGARDRPSVNEILLI
jgi:hypothetical protein